MKELKKEGSGLSRGFCQQKKRQALRVSRYCPQEEAAGKECKGFSP
jgi:hypothetical protein